MLSIKSSTGISAIPVFRVDIAYWMVAGMLSLSEFEDPQARTPSCVIAVTVTPRHTRTGEPGVPHQGAPGQASPVSWFPTLVSDDPVPDLRIPTPPRLLCWSAGRVCQTRRQGSVTPSARISCAAEFYQSPQFTCPCRISLSASPTRNVYSQVKLPEDLGRQKHPVAPVERGNVMIPLACQPASLSLFLHGRADPLQLS